MAKSKVRWFCKLARVVKLTPAALLFTMGLMVVVGVMASVMTMALHDVRTVLEAQDRAGAAIERQAVQNEIVGLRTQEGTSCVLGYIQAILAAESREAVRAIKPCDVADLGEIRKNLRRAEQKLAIAEEEQRALRGP